MSVSPPPEPFMNVEGKLVGFAFDDQLPFFESWARNILFDGGIGAGKTTWGAMRALKYAFTFPKSTGFIGCPSFKMAKRSTLPTLKRVAPHGVLEVNTSDMEVRFSNGTVAYVLSGEEPDAWRGINASWGWIDEQVPELAYKNGSGRMREARRMDWPDFPHRSLWITKTPKGKDYAWKEFVLPGNRPGLYEHYRLTSHQAHEHGWIDDDTYEDWLRKYPGRFGKQELGAEYIDSEGMVWPMYDPTIHVWHAGMNIKKLWYDRQPPLSRRYPIVVAGIDFGTTAPSTIIVVARDPRKSDRYYVLDGFYKRKCKEDELVHWAHHLMRKYGVTTFYADSSSPDYIKHLKTMGLPVRKADRNTLIKLRIQRIDSMLQIQDDGLPNLIINDTPMLRHLSTEMQEYMYESPKDELALPSGKPLDENDDMINSLEYALEAAVRSNMPIPAGDQRFVYQDDGPRSKVPMPGTPEFDRKYIESIPYTINGERIDAA